MFDYDTELSRYNARLRAAAGVSTGDRVLDIGCGTGQTTREAGRSAHTGSALGVDLSGPMIERARQLSAEEGPRNVSFERADAQVHPFPPARFTLAMSRFGTMFFADPVAAFADLHAAATARALDRLLEMLDAHDTGEGVWFDSGAWLVSAHRR